MRAGVLVCHVPSAELATQGLHAGVDDVIACE